MITGVHKYQGNKYLQCEPIDVHDEKNVDHKISQNLDSLAPPPRRSSDFVGLTAAGSEDPRRDSGLVDAVEAFLLASL